MQLPDNYFRDKSPAEIIAKVNTITLANISLLGAEELRRIGWLDNPIVDLMYKLGSTGVWVAKEWRAAGDGPSEQLIAWRNQAVANCFGVGSYDAANIGEAAANYLRRRIGTVNITTDGAGAAVDQELVPAVASYKARMEIISIVPIATDAATNLTFEDGDATGVIGLPGVMAMNFTASTRNTQLTGCILYTATANKNLRVDVAGYALSSVLTIQFYYWYEA